MYKYSSCSSFIYCLLVYIAAALNQNPPEPLLVQCDSGVRRSGAYAVIDNCCRQLEKTTKFDMVIFALVF